MCKNNMYLFVIIAIVTFIIWLPTFLLGFNPSISNKCVAYNTFSGNVYKTKVYEETCSKCVKKDKKGNCERYTYYSCWDAYVYAHDINSNNQTISSCKLQTAESSKSEYSAEKSTEKYKIGENVNWYKKKGTSNCETGSKVISLWYVGVVFLSLTGLVLLVGFIVFVFTKIKIINNYKIIDNEKNNKNNKNINISHIIEFENTNNEKV